METIRTNAEHLSPQEQYLLRKSVIRLYQKGMPAEKIADVLDISRTTVYNTIKTYKHTGMEGLKPRTRGRKYGEKRLLTLQQEKEIQRTIVDKNPEQLKMACCMWTRKAVHEVIERMYGIELNLSSLGYYLRRWGFTVQRPIKRASKQDAERIAKWKEEEYPVIVTKARADNATIYWGDETALQNTCNQVKGYAPRGQTPVLEIEAQKLKLNMISAVTNQGLLRFIISKESINSDKLIEFMEKLIKDTNGKVYLILDNLRVHHSKAVSQWLEKHKSQIEVFYLPPYAPEYNPDEYLNSDLKRAMESAAIPHSHADIQVNAESFLSLRGSQPDKVMGYFASPFTSYAS